MQRGRDEHVVCAQFVALNCKLAAMVSCRDRLLLPRALALDAGTVEI